MDITIVEYTPKSIAVYGADLKFFQKKLALLGGRLSRLPRIDPTLEGYIFPKTYTNDVKAIFKEELLRDIVIYYNASYYNKISECLELTSQKLDLDYQITLKTIYLTIFTQTPQSRSLLKIYPDKYFMVLKGYFNSKDLKVFSELNGRLLDEMTTTQAQSYGFSLSQYKKLESYLLKGTIELYREPSWRFTKKEKLLRIKDCSARLWRLLRTISNFDGIYILKTLESISFGCETLFTKLLAYINPSLDYKNKFGLFNFFLAQINNQTRKQGDITTWVHFTPYEEITYIQSYDDLAWNELYFKKLQEKTLVQPISHFKYEGYGLDGRNIYTVGVSRSTD